VVGLCQGLCRPVTISAIYKAPFYRIAFCTCRHIPPSCSPLPKEVEVEELREERKELSLSLLLNCSSSPPPSSSSSSLSNKAPLLRKRFNVKLLSLLLKAFLVCWKPLLRSTSKLLASSCCKRASVTARTKRYRELCRLQLSKILS
jgi:hypothetical protein